MAASKKNVETIELKPVDAKTITVRVRGTAPLIMHKWSEKAKRQILEKQMKKASAKEKSHEAKDPFADFCATAYWMSGEPTEYTPERFDEAIANGATFGFPATAFKQAAIAAAYRAGVVANMAGLRAAFFIKGYGENQLVQIKGDAPHIREDMVKVGLGVADVRHRAQFDYWYADLEITYNANGAYSVEQLLNILELGGFSNGVGEWRPERDGNYGTFHVENVIYPGE